MPHPANPVETERIQRIVARVISTHPAGHNLLLIGGFRYRLLDQSARRSLDIDYHWSGDLSAKQRELIAVCRRTAIPLVERQLGYEGDARAVTGPEAVAPSARFVNLAFWKNNVPFSRIELSLEITRVPHVDPVTVRTAEGVVYPTLSDADLVEAKVIAVINRIFLAHRDLIDLFLFGDRFLSDSPERLKTKMKQLHIERASIERRLDDLRQAADYHARAVQEVIGEQLDAAVAANLAAAGGGETVFGRVLTLLENNLAPS